MLSLLCSRCPHALWATGMAPAGQPVGSDSQDGNDGNQE